MWCTAGVLASSGSGYSPRFRLLPAGEHEEDEWHWQPLTGLPEPLTVTDCRSQAAATRISQLEKQVLCSSFVCDAEHMASNILHRACLRRCSVTCVAVHIHCKVVDDSGLDVVWLNAQKGFLWLGIHGSSFVLGLCKPMWA